MNERRSSDVATAEPSRSNSVRVRRLGLDTQYEAIVFMRKDCQVCRSEGFSAHTRVLLCNGKRRIIATLYQVTSDLIDHVEAGLSESAWFRLGLKEGDSITVTHPEPLDSLSLVRSRIYGHDLTESSLKSIIQDVVDGKYSDIHLSSFLTACAVRPLNTREILALTHDRALYKQRNRIERMFGHLKVNRAIATRYDQLASSFLGMVHLATARYWLKFVHAA